MHSSKVLIIGIDGGSWHVLGPAVAEGFMPRLADLMEMGSWGVLASTIPAITPAAWSAFQTGANPGRTGIFDFTRWDRAERKQILVDIGELPKTMWEAAGEAGRRVGVVNLPMTYPPRPVNGFLVSGLLTPSLDSRFTHPPSLARQLLGAVPGYYIFNLETAAGETKRESLTAFLEWISAILIQRCRAACWLLEREPVDLFMIHFQASDVLQHVLWAYLDPEHPGFDAGKRRVILNRFYRRLDEQIGVVREAFGSTAGGPWTTLVVSDHGFQTHRKRFNLWRWLLEEGYLCLDLARAQSGSGHLPASRPDASPVEEPPVDWEKSRAVASGRSNEAFIYLLEEEPQPRRATSDDLRAKLRAVRDPETASPVVLAVHGREELYEGDRLDRLPDLIVEPNSGYSITGRYEPDAPMLKKVVVGEDFHIGRHHPEGILVATGPVIRPQRDIRAQIVDIAPTVLHLLGISPPPGRDGRVLAELFTDAFLSEHPAETSPAREYEGETACPESSGQRIYTPEEEALIEQRLRDLGYI